MNPTRSGPVAARARDDESRFDLTLRPNVDEYVGQREHKENLKVFVEAARRRGELSITISCCMDLPGLGKTTLFVYLGQRTGC